jgi:hypothetical protein
MNIESEPLTKAGRFLNTVACGPSEAKASRYSYKADPATPTPAITAAGLLTRQYLGWPIDQPMLEPGSKFLMESLPPETGDKVGPCYLDYYATQVLHHMEGDNWDVWNQRMRDHLIRTQERSGHKAGSWSPEGSDWGAQGGRMYSTCLSVLTLEVYYRHLPLYRWIDKAPTTEKPKDDKQAAN